MHRRIVMGLVALALCAIDGLVPDAAGAAAAAAKPDRPFAACQGQHAAVRVGVVTCRRERASDLGGTTAYSYYVPPGCAPKLARRCPTLYLLHGFGGDFTSMLGTTAEPSAWVSSLSRRPKVRPENTKQPWNEADVSRWKPARPIDMVLIAPDGRTVPGGFGPEPLLESFWTDWNPRYAKGGSDRRYDTPAPRFAHYVRRELVADVQHSFPVGRGRKYRAIDGTSLGGYGSYAIGLTHPDSWASMGAVSGIMNILLVRGIGSVPAQLTVPAPAGGRVPLPLLPSQARGFAAATFAFGDPGSDRTYYRGRMPVDLALNGKARRQHHPSIVIRGFSNDTVARRSEDYTSMPGYEVAEAFEDLVFVTNRELNSAFRDAKVAASYQLHPGIHSDVYWNPWLREQEMAQYAAVRHWNGGGHPPRRPTRFSYRTTSHRFSIWGWRVHVRAGDEFLGMHHVTCHGYTLSGSGRVTVTPPPRCRVHPRRGTTTHLESTRRVHVSLSQGRKPATSPSGQR